MLSTLTRLLGLAALILAMTAGLMLYRDHYEKDAKLAKAESEKKALEAVVSHLTSERRVAELLVLRKETAADGTPMTTLLFSETARNGVDRPAKSFTVRGEFIHIDAMVIKFDLDDVKSNDPLRGHSIALFTSIFGDRQAPADAPQIDIPDTIPDVYQDADPALAEFELNLWKNFWKLASDPDYARANHVRIANGQSTWGQFEPGKRYTLTLETAGGLNMTSQPLTGVLQSAIPVQ